MKSLNMMLLAMAFTVVVLMGYSQAHPMLQHPEMKSHSGSKGEKEGSVGCFGKMCGMFGSKKSKQGTRPVVEDTVAHSIDGRADTPTLSRQSSLVFQDALNDFTPDVSNHPAYANQIDTYMKHTNLPSEQYGSSNFVTSTSPYARTDELAPSEGDFDSFPSRSPPRRIRERVDHSLVINHRMKKQSSRAGSGHDLEAKMEQARRKPRNEREHRRNAAKTAWEEEERRAAQAVYDNQHSQFEDKHTVHHIGNTFVPGDIHINSEGGGTASLGNVHFG